MQHNLIEQIYTIAETKHPSQRPVAQGLQHERIELRIQPLLEWEVVQTLEEGQGFQKVRPAIFFY